VKIKMIVIYLIVSGKTNQLKINLFVFRMDQLTVIQNQKPFLDPYTNFVIILNKTYIN